MSIRRTCRMLEEDLAQWGLKWADSNRTVETIVTVGLLVREASREAVSLLKRYVAARAARQ